MIDGGIRRLINISGFFGILFKSLNTGFQFFCCRLPEARDNRLITALREGMNVMDGEVSGIFSEILPAAAVKEKGCGRADLIPEYGDNLFAKVHWCSP